MQDKLSNESIATSSDFELTSEHPFSFEQMAGERGRTPSIFIDSREYNCINNGGWLRIRTAEGAEYYVVQARLRHLTPDWKLHFSIAAEDMPRAWNIIGYLFLEQQCTMSMKMQVPDYDDNDWPRHMYGREITVYIYQHQQPYALLSDGFLSKAEQQTPQFWSHFISNAEERLRQAGIKSRGTAEGDLKIGEYCSIRNERFVEVDASWTDELANICEEGGTRYCYPPNHVGHNPASDTNPIVKSSFFSHLYSTFFMPAKSDSYCQALERVIERETKLQNEGLCQQQQELAQMMTLHIKKIQDEPTQNILLNKLYPFLKHDPWFHFFSEPTLIIRISKKTVREQVAKFLDTNDIEYIIYSYPFPGESLAEAYGEKQEGIVSKHLPLFLHIFHLHAQAALLLSPALHPLYIDRAINNLLAIAAKTVADWQGNQGEYLAALASYKLTSTVSYVTTTVLMPSPPQVSACSEDEQLLLDDLSGQLYRHVKIASQQIKNEVDGLSIDYLSYIERVIHTMFNMAGYSRDAEGKYLAALAAKAWGKCVCFDEPAPLCLLK